MSRSIGIKILNLSAHVAYALRYVRTKIDCRSSMPVNLQHTKQGQSGVAVGGI